MHLVEYANCAQLITVNLAPADLRKEDPAYDLPMAVGLLLASEQILVDLSHALVIGELSLAGVVRHTNGVLPMAAMARDKGFKTLYLPAPDAPEAALIPGLQIYPIESLFALVAHLPGLQSIAPYNARPEFNPETGPSYATDFAEVRGQAHVKRALEVAAAGQHNLIMTGPPGAGKTLLARSIPSILPNLTLDEAPEITRIYSVSDLLPSHANLPFARPTTRFRTPGWSEEVAGPTQARSRSRTAGSCSWTNWMNLMPAHSRSCASRLRTRSSPSAGSMERSPSRRISCWSQP